MSIIYINICLGPWMVCLKKTNNKKHPVFLLLYRFDETKTSAAHQRLRSARVRGDRVWKEKWDWSSDVIRCWREGEREGGRKTEGRTPLNRRWLENCLGYFTSSASSSGLLFRYFLPEKDVIHDLRRGHVALCRVANNSLSAFRLVEGECPHLNLSSSKIVAGLDAMIIYFEKRLFLSVLLLLLSTIPFNEKFSLEIGFLLLFLLLFSSSTCFKDSVKPGCSWGAVERAVLT